MSAQTKTQTSKPKAAKRSPAPVMPSFVLTKPGSEASSKSDKLAVTGFEMQAARVRELQMEIDSLETDLKTEKTELIEGVGAIRKASELAGDFHKTCSVASADEQAVLVIFQDKYSKIDTKHEPALRTHLSDSKYNELFRRGADIKLRSNTSLDALKALLGDKFEAFSNLVEVTEYLAPEREFMEKRATLRSSMTAEQNVAVDMVIDQCQYAPQVKVK